MTERIEATERRVGTTRNEHLAEGKLYPFPEGWYVVAESRELACGELKERIWLGRSIVYWRDLHGDVCVADGICPHLGSHLGPTAGGKLNNGNLVCPFHGFEYDVSGSCVRARDVKPPRSAQLTRFAVTETSGLIFAYFGRDATNPRWQTPLFPADNMARDLRRMQFRAHPQTTSENSVDMNHLEEVHGYTKLTQLRETEVCGPFLFSSYSFTRNMLTFGLRKVKFDVEITIGVWGLGVSTVNVATEYGILARQWVLSTPLDGEMIEMWLIVDVRKLPNWWWLNRLVRRPAAKLAAKLAVNDLEWEVRKDAVIWDKQNFRSRPAYSALDRDISLFRRYCQQFYSKVAQ